MANTEGMSDEVMQELLTPSSASSSLAASGRRKTKKSTKSAIRDRLNMPMGERPAATVIRRSKRPLKTSATAAQSGQGARQTEKDKETTTPPPPPVVKGIVERPVQKQQQQQQSREQSSTTASSNSRPKSKFALQRQANGFPSVNRPLGTFAKRKVDFARDDRTKKDSPAKTIFPTAGGGKDTTTAAAAAASPSPTSAQGIKDASVRDANAMFSGMSNIEIKDNLEDLQSSLSPDMLAFLKKRGQQKQQQQQQQQTKTVTKTEAATGNKETSEKPKSKESTDDVQEKNRIGQLLSSVKTFEDMDRLYEEELTPFNEQGSRNLTDKDPLEQAYALLRSSAPRQNLWASKTVCENLESALQKQEAVCIGSDGNWPYPVLLPVSLRCLLDAPTAQTNGLALYTYVLRSLYTLLKLRTPEEHVVDVEQKQESPEALFQTTFLNDAVPTPSFGSLYPKVAGKAVVKSDTGEAMAYSTSSSSTSALQDGQAFLQDPLWTLLTKMKIIPRLAQLLGYELPEEALVAVMGILACLSARSPGAAAAISQHKILMKTLLKRTMSSPTDSFNTQLSLPLLVLFNTMARQSRHVADSLPFEGTVLPLLAMKSASLDRVQIWGLMLWRKLLRYGLGLTHLSSLVALSIPYLSAPTNNNTLASCFRSCFAVALDCIKIPSPEKAKKLSEEERNVLQSTIDWLGPSTRQCAQQLAIRCNPKDLASHLSLLASYCAACTHWNQRNEANGFESILVETSLLSNLETLVVSGSKEVLSNLSTTGPSEAPLSDEAAICSYVDSLGSLVSALRVNSGDNASLEPTLEKLEKGLVEVFVAWLTEKVVNESTAVNNRLRRAWVNQCHFMVAKFLLANANCVEGEEAKLRVRSFALHLIGRLQKGDEAKAAILFSNDSLFQCEGSLRASSPLSTIFMQETCASPEARAQLDHSFKLQRGFGITAEGFGPFATDSLLSEAERSPGSGGADRNNSGLALPLGPAWLWRVLPGSIKSTTGTLDTSTADQVKDIISACLGLLLDIETKRDVVRSFDMVQLGCKVYYLVNVCLYPEIISCDNGIGLLVCELLDSISSVGGTNDSFGQDFILACFEHSRVSSAGNKEDAKDEKLLAVLSGTPDISARAMRAVTDFLEEFCNTFIEFGAQYKLFSKIARLFLQPLFPSRIQCEIVKRLREMLHLLSSVDGEEETLQQEVSVCIRTGVPDGAGVPRDSGDLLDLVCDIVKKNQGGQGGFFRLYSISIIARNLAGCIRSKTGVQAFKRRLLGCSGDVVDAIFRSTNKLLDGSAKDSLEIVLSAAEQLGVKTRSFVKDETLQEVTFDAFVTRKSIM